MKEEGSAERSDLKKKRLAISVRIKHDVNYAEKKLKF